MMRTPWTLPERFETKAVVALVLVSLVATVLMALAGESLVTADNPNGIIGFELAGGYERSAAILASWDSAARSAAHTQTLWDSFLYIPLYVAALVSWAGWCSRRLTLRWLAGIGVLLAWAMIGAGLCDQVENWQMLKQLESGADGHRAELAAGFAYAKFAIFYATFAYVLLTSIGIAGKNTMMAGD
jgi:hypothetical protein